MLMAMMLRLDVRHGVQVSDSGVPRFRGEVHKEKERFLASHTTLEMTIVH